MRFDATVSFSFDADTEEEALEAAHDVAAQMPVQFQVRDVVVDEVRIAETGEVPQVDNPN